VDAVLALLVAARVAQRLGGLGSRRGRTDQAEDKASEGGMKEYPFFGLQTPITIRQDEEGGYHLIAGLHRLKAAEQLQWHFIEASVVQWDDLTVRQWEIAENLHRADLTALEHDQHVAEWVKIEIEKQKQHELQSGHFTQIESKRTDGRGHRPEGGVAATARDLGIERTKVRRALEVDKIAPEAKEAAVEAGIANTQSDLLKVAAISDKTPEEQIKKVHEIAAEKASRERKRKENAALKKQDENGDLSFQEGLEKFQKLLSRIPRNRWEEFSIACDSLRLELQASAA
jgi:ParB-like chromosome segregation protein Spo0J